MALWFKIFPQTSGNVWQKSSVSFPEGILLLGFYQYKQVELTNAVFPLKGCKKTLKCGLQTPLMDYFVYSVHEEMMLSCI